MRKITAILLILALLLPWAALAEGAELSGKAASRTGPGTQYSEELGALTLPMTLTVVGRVDGETGWYHVEYTKSQKLYRVYILQSRVKNAGDVPVESSAYTEDTIIADTKSYYGPGEHYAARPGILAANTAVRVFGVDGEWALCDFRDDWRWARGYIHVSNLAHTTVYSPALIAAPETPVPVQATEEPWSVAEDSWSVTDEEPWSVTDEPWSVEPETTPAPAVPAVVSGLPLSADMLPMVNAAAFLSLTAPENIYVGPGEQYPVQTPGDQTASLGILFTGVRVYGMENGLALIRYFSGEPGEFRYGWVTPAALAGFDQVELPALQLTGIPAVLTRAAILADDPDILAEDGTELAENTPVTALAFLNGDPAYVYCEYTQYENGQFVNVRGFLPAEDLRTR